MDEEDIIVLLIVQEILSIIKFLFLFVQYYQEHYIEPRARRIEIRPRARYRLADRLQNQLDHMRYLVNLSDTDCIEQLRMDRNAFDRLCFLVESVGGLVRSRNVQIPEKVAIFLSILAHHKKNRVVKFDFKRSGYTISKYFNEVLESVLKLHTILLVSPEPVADDCTDDKWKWFKGCLGALDGTYIQVRVPLHDKARYRNRKGEIYVNVLGVCDRNMNYSFVLSGWEGSAADSRILRDVVCRPNGLRVPTGKYYLCDCGYTNSPGFLAPYRGVRYHLDEWGTGSTAPNNHKELFNLRHAKARNIVERSFSLLKSRWAILRSNSFYPIKTQNLIIMACCLLHNFIRTTMAVDPLEDEIPEYVDETIEQATETDYVDHVDATPEWSNWRDNLAVSMFNEWQI